MTEFSADAAQMVRPRLMLTAAVAAGEKNIQAGYDIAELSKVLDFVSLMSYDLHGSWEDFLGHNAPLYPRADETGEQRLLNVEWAAKRWVDGGCPPAKLNIGLATYGRSFTMSSFDWEHDMGDPAEGAGKAGRFTAEDGYLSYYEICEMLRNGATRLWHDEHQGVPYLYTTDKQWVGYDDEQSIDIKVKWSAVIMARVAPSCETID
ncbi:PREDICTED: acidic mammalian chitinase-like, partial [Priapulus caudatus]|uniref:Acidic mammalian chitinase-like n=1 Tax=Priapulus caudatus TaxID=37621 RepID=A0ABM1E6F2_PRICU